MKRYLNAFTPTIFQQITQVTVDRSLNWSWVYPTSGDFTGVEPKPWDLSWSLNILEPEYRSPLSDFLVTAAITAIEQVDPEFQQAVRVRLGLITAQPTTHVHGAHIDLPFAHRTALFYINDNNGATLIYNQRWDPETVLSRADYQTQVLNNEFTVLESVMPQANSLYIFDGLHYHSSSTPTDVSRRVVMTVNYTYQ
jgi:hypothetical protein